MQYTTVSTGSLEGRGISYCPACGSDIPDEDYEKGTPFNCPACEVMLLEEIGDNHGNYGLKVMGD